MTRFGRGLPHATAALLLAFGCQSIAGVQDVTYTPEESGECASYCSTLKEACPGDVAVYEDEETCKKVCGLLKAGNSSKPQGNTLACRSAQAEVALRLSDDFSENQTNCAAAGPGGGNKCTIYPTTPDCEGYCTIYMAACTTTKDWGFNTFEQCVERCAAFPHSGSYTAAKGQDGDTLSCRLYHATLATVDPDNNCESAGLRPVGDCLGSGDPSCEDYCRVNTVACRGEYEAYETNRQCNAVCEATRKGNRVTDTGNQDTVGCRSYHSYYALMGEPSPHCSHSGPAGDGVCNDDKEHPNCIAFCRFFASGCPARFEEVYASKDAACVDDCEKLEDANVEGGNLYSIPRAERGNTLKCRTLNAVRALTDPASPDAPGYCDAAVGESPCN